MSLSSSLSSIDLTFRCPVCNYPLVKKGGWIWTFGRFKCPGCQSDIRLTYRNKVAIFESTLNWLLTKDEICHYTSSVNIPHD